jgi:hypothetical protein
VEDDVTITQEDLNTGKQTAYMENSQTPYKKIMWTKNPPYYGFPQAMSVLRQKVLQSPSMTGLSKTEIIRGTA